MIENGSSQIPTLTATGAPPESPSISDAHSFAFGAWFEQSAKVVLTILIVFLLFPAMLMLSVLAILIARVLGVPLWAPPSSFTQRARSPSE